MLCGPQRSARGILTVSIAFSTAVEAAAGFDLLQLPPSVSCQSPVSLTQNFSRLNTMMVGQKRKGDCQTHTGSDMLPFLGLFKCEVMS